MKKRNVIYKFESFISCLETLPVEIEERYRSIEGVVDCQVGHGPDSFVIEVETTAGKFVQHLSYKSLYHDIIYPNTISSMNQVNTELYGLITQLKKDILTLT